MDREPFYCIHCLRKQQPLRRFETIETLMAHTAVSHHGQQPLHGRDWLWGAGELEAFFVEEQVRRFNAEL